MPLGSFKNCSPSYAADARDGGISTALSDLIAAQHDFGLLPEWHK